MLRSSSRSRHDNCPRKLLTPTICAVVKGREMEGSENATIAVCDDVGVHRQTVAFVDVPEQLSPGSILVISSLETTTSQRITDLLSLINGASFSPSSNNVKLELKRPHGATLTSVGSAASTANATTDLHPTFRPSSTGQTSQCSCYKLSQHPQECPHPETHPSDTKKTSQLNQSTYRHLFQMCFQTHVACPARPRYIHCGWS